MKIMISYQVDTVEEAKEVMAAVENRGKLTTFRVQDEAESVIRAAVECAAPTISKEFLAECAEVPRANINPGAPLITKIGTATKEIILGELKRGLQPAQPKYFDHCKLLWSRNEIKFDGKEYYL